MIATAIKIRTEATTHFAAVRRWAYRGSGGMHLMLVPRLDASDCDVDDRCMCPHI
jgi:hypothetical protein